ncbi:MAG TPA: TonB family protein [Lacunisphaera sp.]|nr:TonB family protein [Lacunisphaera sp.]
MFFPRRFPIAAMILGLAVGNLVAQVPSPRPPGGENVGLLIEQVGVLAYPPSMTYEAIYSGEARIAISVDAQGKLDDFLVIAYTHEDFAKAAVMALKRWRYQPALVRGEPRASRTEILFEFKDQGVIVQNLPGALERRMIMAPFGEHYVYAPCRLSELDELPEPLDLAKPQVKGDGHSHTVAVEFYIDEAGLARMPAVDRTSADDRFAAAAVRAVEQWRFKPPLRKGRAVLVRAQQVFTFEPRTESGSAPKVP